MKLYDYIEINKKRFGISIEITDEDKIKKIIFENHENDTSESHPEILATIKKHLQNPLSNNELFKLIEVNKINGFKHNVYKQLLTVTFGNTISYNQLAKKCNIRSSRAIGQAMAKNPFPLLIPCHRVIRSDGTLGGYAGGLELKKELLNLEKSTK